MGLNVAAINDLIQMVGGREASRTVILAKRQDRLESTWQRRARQRIREITDQIIANADRTSRLKLDMVDFDELLMAHSRAAMEAGIVSAEAPPSKVVKLARSGRPPRAAVPMSLKALRFWWDLYRKGGQPDQRQAALAERLKNDYVDRLQKVWREASDDFLSGNTTRHTAAIEAIQKQADVVYSRAQMIVETETTYYFNKARRQIYDDSTDVTHYLFMAIRDHATTKWCKTRQGLVYSKTDPLLDKETPPIHWNCRSELIPLSRHNPNHLRLIQDLGRSRRHHSPEPLPVGWTTRRAGG